MPVSESESEPVSEPVSESESEPVSEPLSESESESVSESESEPVSESRSAATWSNLSCLLPRYIRHLIVTDGLLML